MYNILFYIFFFLIIAAMFITAFSRSLLNSAFSIIIILISLGGLFTLLNSGLFSFLHMIVTLSIFVLLLIFHPGIRQLALGESIEILPNRYYLTITVSLACAIITSLVSSTRWQLFEINFDLNSFSLLFIKYLPAIFMLVIISSVILSTFGYLRRKDETA